MDLNLRPLDVFLVIRYQLESMIQTVEHPSGTHSFLDHHAGQIKLLSTKHEVLCGGSNVSEYLSYPSSLSFR